MSASHTLNENHANKLKQMCGLKEAEEFGDAHKKLLEKYWELKRVADRISVSIGDRELAMLVFLCGFGKVATAKEAAPPSVLVLFKNKQIAFGTKVNAIWRGQPAEGEFHGVTADGHVKVLIGSEVRQLDEDKVFLIEPEADPAQQAA